MATATKKTLGQRMVEALADVHSIEKDSYNEHGGFPYASHDSYMEAARPILTKHGIVPNFSMLECTVGKTGMLAKGQLVLINSTDAEDMLPSTAFHFEPFRGGKTSGKEAGACYSYLAKYLIGKALMMSSGEDADAEPDEDGVNRPKPRSKKAAPKPKAKAAAPKKPAPRKATKKKPPALPPSEVDEDGEYEAIIPAEAWDAVRDTWHTRGTITEKQAGRLFAISRNEGGWDGDAMKAEIDAGLGVGLDDLPWGDPYEATVEIFTQYSPDGDVSTESDEDEGVDDGDPDGDIPF